MARLVLHTCKPPVCLRCPPHTRRTSNSHLYCVASLAKIHSSKLVHTSGVSRTFTAQPQPPDAACLDSKSQLACAGPLSVCDAPPGAHALLIIFPDQFAQPSEYEQLAFAIQVGCPA